MLRINSKKVTFKFMIKHARVMKPYYLYINSDMSDISESSNAQSLFYIKNKKIKNNLLVLRKLPYRTKTSVKFLQYYDYLKQKKSIIIIHSHI